MQPKLICPFLNKKCIEKRCTFWVEQWRKDDKGEIYTQKSCAIPLLVEVGARQLTETIRTIATLDALRADTIGAHNAAVSTFKKAIDSTKKELNAKRT